MADAVLEVETKLEELTKGLNDIKKSAGEVGTAFEAASKKASQGIRDQSKQTESFLQKISGLAKNVAENIMKDFSLITAVEGVVASAFAAAGAAAAKGIKDSVNLSDSLAVLRTRVGGNVEMFDKMKVSLISMAAQGRLSVNGMTAAIDGLQTSSLTSLDTIRDVAAASAMLAAAHGERGGEANVSAAAGAYFKLKGGQPNASQTADFFNQMHAGANASGDKASVFINKAVDVLNSMDVNRRKDITPQGLAQTVAVENQIPGFTTLVKELKGIPKLYNSALRGLGDIVDSHGVINPEKFKKYMKILGDSTLGTTIATGTYGLSSTSATAINAANANADAVTKILDKLNGPQTSQRTQAYETAGAWTQIGTVIGTLVSTLSVSAEEVYHVTERFRDAAKLLGWVADKTPEVAGHLPFAAVKAALGLVGLDPYSDSTGFDLLGNRTDTGPIQGYKGQDVPKHAPVGGMFSNPSVPTRIQLDVKHYPSGDLHFLQRD